MNNTLKWIIFLIIFWVVSFAFFFPLAKWLRTKTVYAFEAKPEEPRFTFTNTSPIRLDKWEHVKKIIREEFGDDADIAIAISEVECNHERPEWPKCVNTSPVEHSIGIFQINLAKDWGHGTKVHWDKVPGDTLQEKEEWLKIPENNIKLAKKIYDKSGFYPWSGYTSGAYKNHL